MAYKLAYASEARPIYAARQALQATKAKICHSERSQRNYKYRIQS